MKNRIMVIGLLALFAVQNVMAGAATADVNTRSRSGMTSQYSVYTNTIIYAGTIVCLNSASYAVPAADAPGNIVVGKAEQQVDNRTNAKGAGDSGTLKINVSRGVFGWGTNTTMTATSIGSLCYVADDNNVTTAAGSNNIIAGTCVDVSGGYAWVDTFNIGRTAGSFTTLAANGAVAFSSTLAAGATTITGAATVSSTLSASGYKIGTISGLTGLKTNAGTGYTNVWMFSGGILTNVTFTGTMP
jgi:hypothetical protein